MPLFGKKKSKVPSVDPQVAAEADWRRLSVKLPGAGTSYFTAGGSYHGAPPKKYEMEVMAAFLNVYGTPLPPSAVGSTWEGFAYLVPDGDGVIGIEANGIRLGCLSTDTAEDVGAVIGRTPTVSRCSLFQLLVSDRGNLMEPPIYRLELTPKLKKEIEADRKAAQPLPPPPAT